MNSCVTVHRKSRVLGNTSSIASADEDLKFHAADSTSSRRVKGYCIILLVCVHSLYIQNVFLKKFNVKCMPVFRYSRNWFMYDMNIERAVQGEGRGNTGSL